jgi:hypothetical protein
MQMLSVVTLSVDMLGVMAPRGHSPPKMFYFLLKDEERLKERTST